MNDAPEQTGDGARDPLAGDWSEGLPGPARPLDIPAPRRLGAAAAPIRETAAHSLEHEPAAFDDEPAAFADEPAPPAPHGEVVAEESLDFEVDEDDDDAGDDGASDWARAALAVPDAHERGADDAHAHPDDHAAAAAATPDPFANEAVPEWAAGAETPAEAEAAASEVTEDAWAPLPGPTAGEAAHGEAQEAADPAATTGDDSWSALPAAEPAELPAAQEEEPWAPLPASAESADAGPAALEDAWTVSSAHGSDDVRAADTDPVELPDDALQPLETLPEDALEDTAPALHVVRGDLGDELAPDEAPLELSYLDDAGPSAAPTGAAAHEEQPAELEPELLDADLLVPVDDEPHQVAHGSLRVEGEHRVAVHTRAGRTRRGSVRDADFEELDLVLFPQGGGAAETLAHDEIKAVFFMLAPGEKVEPGDGARVRLDFGDGRSIEGRREGLPGSRGFFLVPQDAQRTNTRRIYIATDAVHNLEELGV